jgi:hypothetical protein
MSSKCLGCGHRTSATAGYCQSCKSKRFHARKRIKEEGLIVEQAGGSWWIWDKKGDVLVMGQPTKTAAVDAFAFGQEEDDYEAPPVHHTTKKSSAQLDAEIAAALSQRTRRNAAMRAHDVRRQQKLAQMDEGLSNTEFHRLNEELRKASISRVDAPLPPPPMQLKK